MFTAPKYINPQWNLLNIAQSKNLFFGISPLEIAYKSREGIHELFEMSICTQVRQSRNSDGSETVLKLFQNYWRKARNVQVVWRSFFKLENGVVSVLDVFHFSSVVSDRIKRWCYLLTSVEFYQWGVSFILNGLFPDMFSSYF